MIFSVSLAEGVIIGQTNDVKLNKTEAKKYSDVANDMKEHYQKGELYLVIKLYLEKCCGAKDSSNKTEKPYKENKDFRKAAKTVRSDIYNWVARSYIGLDQPEMAEKLIKNLVVLKREEGIDSNWLPISRITDKFYVTPKWLFGFVLGANFIFPHPVTDYPIPLIANDSYVKNYGINFGGQIGGVAEHALTKNLSLTLQMSFIEREHHYKINRVRKEGNTTKKIEYKYNQKSDYWEFPILLKYKFLLEKKLQPYLQIGIYTDIIDILDKPLRTATYTDSEGLEMVRRRDMIKDKGKWLKWYGFGFWSGVGIRWKLGKIRVELEGNYKHGLNTISDRTIRDNYLGYWHSSYDTLDDLKLRNLTFSFRILFPAGYKAFKK